MFVDNPTKQPISITVGYLEETGLVSVMTFHDDSFTGFRVTPKRALDMADALYHAVDRHHATLNGGRHE